MTAKPRVVQQTIGKMPKRNPIGLGNQIENSTTASKASQKVQTIITYNVISLPFY